MWCTIDIILFITYGWCRTVATLQYPDETHTAKTTSRSTAVRVVWYGTRYCNNKLLIRDRTASSLNVRPSVRRYVCAL
eukprot:scaffold8306_cov171-Amphora_coffeaeformis.AAC.10